jgi:cation diffusion facilitator CzcD-associated flavoprotein CzcO
VASTSMTSERTAQRWLDELGRALEQGDFDAIDELFLSDGYWRDLLALTWDFRTLHGPEKIKQVLAERLQDAGFSAFALADGLTRAVLREPAPEMRFVEAFFDFETRLAHGRGVARLKRDSDGEWRAWTFLTQVTELKGHELLIGSRRPLGHSPASDSETRQNWRDRRSQEQQFNDTDPEVVIVGAGQGGLAVAATLKLLGIETLVIEKNERVGDNWRKRYDSLVLHDPVWADHMPFLPFPESWPVYTPKDKLASWFEHYAEAMELNVWTGVQLLDGAYDDDSGRWTLHVHPKDARTRELHPAHVVLATGTLDAPVIPEFDGMESYRGVLRHSADHPGGEDWSGRRAVVIGACVSGHDIAQDLHEYGAEVTMVQRSSTYVLSQEHGIPAIFGQLYYEGGPPLEEADLLNVGTPWHVVLELHKGVTQMIAEQDRELLSGLEAAGFKLDYGIDGGGLMSKALRRSGGFYIDVGCSQLIVDGKIAVRNSAIERFTETGVVLEDGTQLDADVIVMATGYTGMRDTARRLFGDELGDRVRDVWNLDEEGELRTIWRESGHPGFWFMGGPLAMTRVYGPLLALQIKAVHAGLIEHPSASRAGDSQPNRTRTLPTFSPVS